jgi:hypothetical protein
MEDPFAMVWSPNGKAICGGCTASLKASADLVEKLVPPPAINETEPEDIDAFRRYWSRRGGALMCTHVFQPRGPFARKAAYFDKSSGRRLVLRAILPLLPERLRE